MNYAIKTPDGQGLHKVILNGELPEGKTVAELDLWPVDATIPEGFRQDFATGTPARGWQLVNGVVVAILEPIPAPGPSPVPLTVSPWQMRRALNQLGLRENVEAAVAAADQNTKDGWDYALEIRRDNPLIGGLAAALGLDSNQLDDLFRLAASFQ